MTSQEQRILDRLVQGDNETWRELFAELIPRYTKLFKKLTLNDETAEDFTCEACIHLVKVIKKIAD